MWATEPKKKKMNKFKQIEGSAVSLPIINIDTDMIIPKQFLKTIKRTGLGQFLFHEMRTNEDESINPDFVLNQPAFSKAEILIAGKNFGCGSSREHAAWALLDFGIKCVIAPSFADIFYNNAIKNGILPIAISEAIIEKLMADVEKGANAKLMIDLEAQKITRPDGQEIQFEIDSFDRHCLLNGLDDISITLTKEQSISDFENSRANRQPWA